MKKLTILALSLLASLQVIAKPLVIEKQGILSVGGTTIVHDGAYDNSKFLGWTKMDESGQSYRADHASVHYQIPENAKNLPLVYVHGFGGSSSTWTSTPDGRDSFSTLMLKKGYSSYAVDLPGRGQAGRTSASTTIEPMANEMFWFDIWRIGEWPNYNEGVQFSKDPEYLDAFFRELTPDLSDHKQDVPALKALSKKIGDHILVTHSAGGLPGWLDAIQNEHVKAIASYEPGGFIFTKDNAPEKIDGLTGGVAPVIVSDEEYQRLLKIPVVIYFGDYIPLEKSTKLGDENWRVRLQMAKIFVDTINKNGGNASLVELPKLGIKGNTHFLMQDLNNDVLANLLEDYFKKQNLDK